MPAVRMNRALTVFVVALFAVMAMVTTSSGQQSKATKYQFKVGVLPFVDNTGSGGEDVGTTVGRAVQAELTHSTQLIGRVLKLGEGTTADDLDAAKATELGKGANVDVVLVGLVLEAESKESQKGIHSPSVFGTSVGGNTHSVTSVVTLQGDVYNVADGQKIESIRVTGRATDRKVGTDVSSNFGSISSGGNADNSPIGKALHNAVADLVKRINALQSKMVPNQPPAEPK